jgi:hypothetical protein
LGLCDVIASLADAVADKHGSRSSWDNLLIHILRAAPIYRDAGGLDAWDEAFRYARRGATSSPILELLDAIADLGSHNLYGAFDAHGTEREYTLLVQKFGAAGVQTPLAPNLSGW